MYAHSSVLSYRGECHMSLTSPASVLLLLLSTDMIPCINCTRTAVRQNVYLYTLYQAPFTSTPGPARVLASRLGCVPSNYENSTVAFAFLVPFNQRPLP